MNFVLRDSQDRIWITVSTRMKNWMHALRIDLADGYLARYEDGEFRIVADGFRFTNEIRFDAKEEFLYVVETTGGCITRLRIDERGTPSNARSLGRRPSAKARGRTASPSTATATCGERSSIPTSCSCSRPRATCASCSTRATRHEVDALEQAFFENRVTEDVLFATGRGVAPWMASVTFGGPDLADGLYRIAEGDPHSRISARRCAGLPMVHWNDGHLEGHAA